MTPQAKAKTRPPAEPVAVGQHDPALNIEQRLLNVMAELSYVQRNRRAPNEIGGFSFVSHDAVTAAVRPLLVKHGVLCLPTIIDHTREGNQTTLLVDLAFINTDRPEDRCIVRSVGYGIDKQDKGPGKAMSYAVKYGLLKTFSLETGDDVEAAAVDRTTGEVLPRANGSTQHTPGRPPLAKFWAVARGQKVPEEVIHLWFERNLGLTSTKDASDAQLAQATEWAQAFMGRAKRLAEAGAVTGLDARGVVEQAGRMFDGVTALGQLTLPEWAQLIEWADAKANATLDQAASEDEGPPEDDLPF